MGDKADRSFPGCFRRSRQFTESLEHLLQLGTGITNSWAKPWRVLLKAEVMSIGENPGFVVTSLVEHDAGILYEELYCARGQAENFIKYLKTDLASDRTSCTTFLANCMRLLMHSAAYVLHQQIRTQGLKNTSMEQAQPSSVISKLFKIAVQVRQTKSRVTSREKHINAKYFTKLF